MMRVPLAREETPLAPAPAPARDGATRHATAHATSLQNGRLWSEKTGLCRVVGHLLR
jgi:hypothetical protein